MKAPITKHHRFSDREQMDCLLSWKALENLCSLEHYLGSDF